MKTVRAFVLGPLMLGLIGACATAGMAAAQDFDLNLGALRIGRLEVRADVTGDTYRSHLSIRTTGLVGAARPVTFSGKSSGKTAAWPQPARYDEEVDTGRRVSTSRLDWAGGTPDITRYSAEPAEAAPPPDRAALAGAVDPASAVFAVVSGMNFCGKSFAIFDGQRLNGVRFAQSTKTDAGFACEGRLKRIAGYSAEEMAERSGFDLGLSYAQDGDTLRLIGAEVQTIYGKLRVKQR